MSSRVTRISFSKMQKGTNEARTQSNQPQESPEFTRYRASIPSAGIAAGGAAVAPEVEARIPPGDLWFRITDAVILEGFCQFLSV